MFHSKPVLMSPDRYISPSGLTTSYARSRIMSRIRGRGNKSTEGRLARLLRQAGLGGWRRHLRLPGTPDFAFRKARLAVFVDGCFWHGCPRCYISPRQNGEFWRRKIDRNRSRDVRVKRALKARGWKVLRLWECRLSRSPRATIKRVAVSLSLCISEPIVNKPGLRCGRRERGT